MRALPLLLVTCSLALLAPRATGDVGYELRTFLEALDAGAAPTVGEERLHHPRMLSTLYRERDHQPIWTDGGPLRERFTNLVRAVERSLDHGLSGADYHLQGLQTIRDDPASHTALAIELLASDAFLRQVRHRSTGAVSPRELDLEWHALEPEVDAVATLRGVAASGAEVGGALDRLWPTSAEYRELVDHRARILTMGEVEVLKVSAGPLLKPGQTGERVVELKQRLLGPDEHDAVFDDVLRAAVVAFQHSAGLEPDGVVGDATLEVLNASRFSWIDRIDANLERWRWLPRADPPTYVRVNIAAFSLRVIERGEDVLRMDVIVGRPYRRTPVFTESIKYMVFNPYWNVPYRLAVQDKLPVLKQNPAELEAQGFEVRPEGEQAFVPVTQIDWSGVERGSFRYLLRQRPGPYNALGQVKFMLPNPHAVYLHDTPSRELFHKAERSFSSGCVRLSQPLELARWILDHDGQPQESTRVPEIVASGDTRTVYLRTPLPAQLVYFTAFTDVAGEVVFRRDLYQRDAPLVAALRSGPSS